MSNWPSEVFSQTLTMVKGGVTYTFKKATMLEKDFILSCWNEAKPVSNRSEEMTESQYYDLIIQRSLKLAAPGKIPLPFEGYHASVLSADGTPVGYQHSRWRRLEDQGEGKILIDKPFTHIHQDHRKKGYYKILLGFATYECFVLYEAPKVEFAVLDSSAAAKKVHTALNATYKNSEQNKHLGELHRLEFSESNWTSYRESEGWTYSVSSENIPITDSRWATTAVTLDSGDRKWNTV